MANDGSNANHTRRSFLATLAAGIAVCGCSGGSAGGSSNNNPQTGGNGRLRALGAGCYSPSMAGYGAQSMACGVGTTFGDPWFDQRFIQELSLQSTFFAGFTPAVYVLDECSVAQANALSDPRGFILFGRWLASKTILETRSELPIAGILAHEWAHQVQFRYGWMQTSEPTVRPTELEADMWSGLYMGMAKLWAGPQLQSYFQALFNMGDFNFNSPGHHGTPNQRLAAGAAGMQFAQYLLNTRQRLSFQELHAVFAREVTRITTSVPNSSIARENAPGDTSGLSYAAAQLAAAANEDWLRGIAAGERSASELDHMPSVPMPERQNLFPY